MELNHRRGALQAPALPPELQPHFGMVSRTRTCDLLVPNQAFYQLNYYHILCGWRDSNPHAFRHLLLRQARLPLRHIRIFESFADYLQLYWLSDSPNIRFTTLILTGTGMLHHLTLSSQDFSRTGGGWGIRTPGPCYGPTVFKTAAIVHSANPPFIIFGRMMGFEPMALTATMWYSTNWTTSSIYFQNTYMQKPCQK